MRTLIGPVTALALLVAACGPAAAPTVPPGASPATRIEVQLTDNLRIEPNPILVPGGEPVTFVVTNTGVIEHEIFFGDEAAQQAHEDDLRSGPAHDSEHGIVVKPGQTREFTTTFTGGDLLAGCHIPGHYPAGMKAAVTVR